MVRWLLVASEQIVDITYVWRSNLNESCEYLTWNKEKHIVTSRFATAVSVVVVAVVLFALQYIVCIDNEQFLNQNRWLVRCGIVGRRVASYRLTANQQQSSKRSMYEDDTLERARQSFECN